MLVGAELSQCCLGTNSGVGPLLVLPASCIPCKNKTGKLGAVRWNCCFYIFFFDPKKINKKKKKICR